MEHDDGFSFGIGAFETMLVRDGRCVMLKDHLARLSSALDSLGIGRSVSEEDILGKVSDGHLDGRVLKVEVSQNNVIFSDRPVPYTESDYGRGFRMRTSRVRRNETSPFTFIKSLQYGDSITEKRKAKEDGFDEPLFLNSRGEVCEGATTNIFFVRGEEIVTPPVRCGLLAGTVRSYVMKTEDVAERHVLPQDIPSFSECFLTNSVLGIMPVTSIDGTVFSRRKVADRVRKRYSEDLDGGL